MDKSKIILNELERVIKYIEYLEEKYPARMGEYNDIYYGKLPAKNFYKESFEKLGFNQFCKSLAGNSIVDTTELYNRFVTREELLEKIELKLKDFFKGKNAAFYKGPYTNPTKLFKCKKDTYFFKGYFFGVYDCVPFVFRINDEYFFILIQLCYD